MSQNQHKTLWDLKEDLDEEGLAFILSDWELDEIKAILDTQPDSTPDNETKHWLGKLVELYPKAAEFNRIIYEEKINWPLWDPNDDTLDGDGYPLDADEDGEDCPVKD